MSNFLDFLRATLKRERRNLVWLAILMWSLAACALLNITSTFVYFGTERWVDKVTLVFLFAALAMHYSTERKRAKTDLKTLEASIRLQEKSEDLKKDK